MAQLEQMKLLFYGCPAGNDLRLTVSRIERASHDAVAKLAGCLLLVKPFDVLLCLEQRERADDMVFLGLTKPDKLVLDINAEPHERASIRLKLALLNILFCNFCKAYDKHRHGSEFKL
jgi:hypothetical protein